LSLWPCRTYSVLCCFAKKWKRPWTTTGLAIKS